MKIGSYNRDSHTYYWDGFYLFWLDSLYSAKWVKSCYQKPYKYLGFKLAWEF